LLDPLDGETVAKHASGTVAAALDSSLFQENPGGFYRGSPVGLATINLKRWDDYDLLSARLVGRTSGSTSCRSSPILAAGATQQGHDPAIASRGNILGSFTAKTHIAGCGIVIDGNWRASTERCDDL